MNRREELAINGVLATLSFLVLAFGYRLFGGSTPGVPALVAIAIAVGALAAGVNAALDGKRRT